MNELPNTADLPKVFDRTLQSIAVSLIRHQQGHRQLILFRGPPGIGATMLARRIPSMLPPLSEHERRWLTIEYSARGYPSDAVERRPFRAPHHTCSDVAMVGNDRMPGELELARFGVLYLDELPEFRPHTARAVRFKWQRMHGAPLIVAFELCCPCGQMDALCSCSDEAIRRYRERAGKMRAELLGTDAEFNFNNLSPVNLRILRKDRAQQSRCDDSATWRERLWRA